MRFLQRKNRTKQEMLRIKIVCLIFLSIKLSQSFFGFFLSIT